MSWDGGRSRIGAVIVGFRNGNRIVRVSPDTNHTESFSKHFLASNSYRNNSSENHLVPPSSPSASSDNLLDYISSNIEESQSAKEK